MAKCDMTDFEVKCNDGHMNKVYKIMPKTLAKDVKHPAYLYAHGGGAFAGSPEMTNGNQAHSALNLNCIVFNCKYRLGPEVKAPRGQ